MFEIGNNLREARLRRRVDLVEAEQDTKIRSKYLAALESEEFDVLPGPVYTRGFLRTYARYLGLDAQRHVDEYDVRFGRFEEEHEQPVLGRRVAPRRLATLRSILVLSLIALAMVAWIGLRGSAGDDGARRVTPASTQTGSSTTAMAVEATAGTNAAMSSRRRVGGNAVALSGAAPARAIAVLRVRAASGPSWIEVHRGALAGPMVYSGTLRTGSVMRFRARRITIIAGFPAALELKVGGHRLTPTTTERRVFTITASGIRPRR